jgi:hypothetical protein
MLRFTTVSNLSFLSLVAGNFALITNRSLGTSLLAALGRPNLRSGWYWRSSVRFRGRRQHSQVRELFQFGPMTLGDLRS